MRHSINKNPCPRYLSLHRPAGSILLELATTAASRSPVLEEVSSADKRHDFSFSFLLHHPWISMAPVGSKRRSTRQAATRKRSRYAEPDTDDDYDFEAEREVVSESKLRTQAPVPKRLKLAVRSKPKPQTRSRTSGGSKHKSTRSSRTTIKSFGRVRKANVDTTSSKKGFTGPSDHKVPDWTSLPIDILRDIFVYAMRSVHESPGHGAVNAVWLIRAARTCRRFTEPALEAYYQSPDLYTSLQPHHLLELLQMPPDKRIINYNVKIKSLSIDVRRLAYIATHRSLFNLSTLVKETPQLHHLEVTHPHDDPPFRSSNRIQTWTYPANLFSTLEDGGQRLKSWKWGREMIAQSDPAVMYTFMGGIHAGKAFESLTRLVVRGFNFSDSAEPQAEEGGAEKGGAQAPLGLATSIALLRNLKDLTFISCDIVMKKFLLSLPPTLERLELTNCLEVHSDMILEYLEASGSQLRELVLNGNAALNLAFLSSLKSACPRLEIVKMDLRYYSERENSNDAQPLYESLLSADNNPTWPMTLRHLELVHPQRLPKDGAQNLFRSLIDAAQDLPDLRYIVLQAHINDISWRDRIPFREEWEGRLQRVFLRKDVPPSPYMGSLRQMRLWKQSISQVSGPSMEKTAGADDEPSPARRMSHVAISPHKATGDTDAEFDVPEGRRRSQRVAESYNSQSSGSVSPGPGSDSDEDTEAGGAWRTKPEKYIQGLCGVVDVRIDNQRPRENQFTERDFLDNEASGDEDWHENSDEVEDGYAW